MEGIEYLSSPEPELSDEVLMVLNDIDISSPDYRITIDPLNVINNNEIAKNMPDLIESETPECSTKSGQQYPKTLLILINAANPNSVISEFNASEVTLLSEQGIAAPALSNEISESPLISEQESHFSPKETLHGSEVVCKEKWNSLRDGYHRCLKRRKSKSSEYATNLKKCKFEDQMEFLTPYLLERTTKTNIERSEPLTSDENTNPNFPEPVNPLSSATTKMFMEMTATKKSKNQPKQKTSVAHVLQEYLHSSPTSTQTENPIDSFFKAMANSTKTLPKDLQLKVNNKIYGIVVGGEMEYLDRKNIEYCVPEDQDNLEIILHYEVPSPRD